MKKITSTVVVLSTLALLAVTGCSAPPAPAPSVTPIATTEAPKLSTKEVCPLAHKSLDGYKGIMSTANEQAQVENDMRELAAKSDTDASDRLIVIAIAARKARNSGPGAEMLDASQATTQAFTELAKACRAAGSNDFE